MLSAEPARPVVADDDEIERLAAARLEVDLENVAGRVALQA